MHQHEQAVTINHHCLWHKRMITELSANKAVQATIHKAPSLPRSFDLQSTWTAWRRLWIRRLDLSYNNHGEKKQRPNATQTRIKSMPWTQSKFVKRAHEKIIALQEKLMPKWDHSSTKIRQKIVIRQPKSVQNRLQRPTRVPPKPHHTKKTLPRRKFWQGPTMGGGK